MYAVQSLQRLSALVRSEYARNLQTNAIATCSYLLPQSPAKVAAQMQMQ